MIATLSPKKTFQPTLPARGATFPPLDEVKGLLVFQPTLPARGATSDEEAAEIQQDFNPRSPHGERHVQNALTRECGSFQPTLPARGATLQAHQGLQHQGISTHAPRTGSDARSL